MNNKKFNIALYIRVANEETTKEDSYIEKQRKELLDYVKQEFKGSKYKFYIDNGYSGRNFNRPGYKEMLKDIKKKDIDLILCTNFSRISRGNVTNIYELIEKYDINIIFLDGTFNTFQKETFQIMKAIHELYCSFMKQRNAN